MVSYAEPKQSPNVFSVSEVQSPSCEWFRSVLKIVCTGRDLMQIPFQTKSATSVVPRVVPRTCFLITAATQAKSGGPRLGEY